MGKEGKCGGYGHGCRLGKVHFDTFESVLP